MQGQGQGLWCGCEGCVLAGWCVALEASEGDRKRRTLITSFASNITYVIFSSPSSAILWTVPVPYMSCERRFLVIGLGFESTSRDEIERDDECENPKMLQIYRPDYR